LPNLEDAPRTTVAATVYRVVLRGIDPLASRGSELNGGRYNSPGTKGVVYASFRKPTAVAEVVRGLKARGINPQEYGPDDWWAYEVELDLSRVLDLTDTRVLERLHVSAEALLASDMTVTRQIGRQALEAGYEAVIGPSAASPGERNLVIFLGAVAREPRVTSSLPVELSQKASG